MHSHHQHLIAVDIASLRPTQISVGLAEVAEKRAQWQQLAPRERQQSLMHHWFPAVLGPGRDYYIIDHHHLGRALHEESVEQGWVMLLKDMSWLEPAVFWRTMEFHQWAHPYGEHGQRCDFSAIPPDVTGLRDDPYRSLVGFVRNAGGFAKDAAPFAEFLWADYFRPHIQRGQLGHDREQAVQEAIRLARLPEARYLPGWSGTHHD